MTQNRDHSNVRPFSPQTGRTGPKAQAWGERVRTMQPDRSNIRPMENVLVLVRHGESEWNKLNRFTGWQDVDLTEEGMAEAHRAGTMLKEAGYQFDMAFSSTLKRAMNSLNIIVGELQQAELPTVRDAALNERDYGDLMGINKEDARKRWGDQQVHLWQRSYEIAPPGGESLKDTEARVFPRLTHGGAHLKDPDKDWPGDVAAKNFA